MYLQQISSISFQYHHPLKTSFKKGLLPNVKVDIYGLPLTQKSISLEHIRPKSLGGTLTYDNLVLADKRANQKRGIQPIEQFVTIENINNYLKQFKNVNNRYIDGNKYIKQIRNTFRKIINDDK